MHCWKVISTKPSVKKEVSAAETESCVKEKSGRPRKKARKEKSVEARAEAIKVARSEAFATVDQVAGDIMEAVEKKVGITKKGTTSNDFQITASSLPKRGHEPGSESVNGAKAGQNDAQESSSLKELSLVIAKEPEVKPSEQSCEPNVLVLDKGAPTVSDLQQGEARKQTKKAKAMEFVRGKSERERKLAVSQRSQRFRKKTLWWGVKLSCRHSTNILPIYDGLWVDVDDIYAPLHFRNEHWIAMWISIPKRHTIVWDNIVSHICREDLDVVMEPFVIMVPYLLVECAVSDEQHVQPTLEPYTYERVTVGVPQCRFGDCGVFILKYIECHALGMSFPPEFCNKNAKAIREKMALDIFKETPECHSKENKDNDENMRTYDSQG
ncbi:hypothetical protein DY000_02009930 [Brassica cretica]|uniref:Ubiquitin-like protease family profile domain-containing protein n=1 Tax=Brassica cretica TaxID=69181 RepID=A0ABQ7CFI9_BRACR|nr:hypothetical protein DY000_02009930 [Brassica cretica]